MASVCVLMVGGAGGSFEYRPALDGVRTVAVYLVVLFHARGGFAAEPLAPGGFVGVDLFFVLSGFIVTSILLREHRVAGTIALRRFYARRARRLLPAAVVTILVSAGLFVLVAPLVERLDYVDDGQASLLYFANWHFIAETNDYFAENTAGSPYLHFWSLAIEEQFYIVFPVVLLGLLWLRNRGVRSAPLVGLGSIGAVSVALQLYWRSADPVRAYYGTDARAYQLMAGAVLALVVASRPEIGCRRYGGAIASSGLVVVLGVALAFDGLDASVRGLVATVGAVALIAGLEWRSGSFTARALSLPAVTYLGAISYGTYLWHWPINLTLDRLLRLGPATSSVIVGVLATALASLSHRLLERPIRSSNRLDRFPITVIACGVATCVVVAVTVLPSVLESRRTPRIIAAAAGDNVRPIDDSDRIPDDIDFGAVRSTRAVLPSCPADDPTDCTTVRGDGPNVVFVGDSVARSFVPTLEEMARRSGWTLTINVRAGCGWVGTPRADGGGREPACEDRRTTWYREILPALDPDVVILLQSTGLNFGASLENGDPYLHAELDAIGLTGAEVIVLDSYPVVPGLSPTVCLSRASSLSSCAFQLADARSSQRMTDGVAQHPDVDLVSLTPLVCPDLVTCPAMIEGVPVWRDRRHVSDVFVPVILDDLYAMLIDTGAFESAAD